MQMPVVFLQVHTKDRLQMKFAFSCWDRFYKERYQFFFSLLSITSLITHSSTLVKREVFVAGRQTYKIAERPAAVPGEC